MTNYLVTAKAEVLYEKAHGIMSKYEEYFSKTEKPLDCIKSIYDILCTYSDKIVLCADEESFEALRNNINEFENIINNVYKTSMVSA